MSAYRDEVIQLVKQGLTNREIADVLGRTVSAISSQVALAYDGGQLVSPGRGRRRHDPAPCPHCGSPPCMWKRDPAEDGT